MTTWAQRESPFAWPTTTLARYCFLIDIHNFLVFDLCMRERRSIPCVILCVSRVLRVCMDPKSLFVAGTFHFVGGVECQAVAAWHK